MDAKFRPCPFCGNTDIEIRETFTDYGEGLLYCKCPIRTGCGAMSGVAKNETVARNKWNIRVRFKPRDGEVE